MSSDHAPSTTVWKYPLLLDLLPPDEPVVVQVPEGAEVLHVGVDPAVARLAVWLAVDPYRTRVERRFRIIGTGWLIEGPPAENAARYCGTAVLGGLVWHVLDFGEPALDPGGPGPSTLGSGDPEALDGSDG